MGYMQEIIRRGNVKYFISQKQEEQNNPVETLDNIGEGSVWYVQEERPKIEEAVMLGYMGGASNSPVLSQDQGTIRWFRSAASKTGMDSIKPGVFDKIASVFKSHNNVFLYNSQMPINLAMLILLGESYTVQELENFCLRYPNISFLDLGGERTNLPFSYNIQSYNNNIEYINILDKQNSTKGARMGIRLDTVNRIFYIGLKGKAYLPINADCFFDGIVQSGTGYSINKSLSVYPKNTLSFFQQVFSDAKTISANAFFVGYDNHIYEDIQNINEKDKIMTLIWSFPSLTSYDRLFDCIGACRGSNIYTNLTSENFQLKLHRQSIIEELHIESLNSSNITYMANMFMSNGSSSSIEKATLQRIFVSQNFVVDQVINSNNMFSRPNANFIGGSGTVWSPSNPSDKTYAHWDEGPSNPGYFWNPNVMDPLVLVSGPQFNQAFMAAVNIAAGMADSDRAPSIQTLTGTFNFIAESNKPNNLLTLSNNDVKQSGDGVAYIGYTYNIADRSFAVYLVSDNIGQNNIKANPNCTDMFAMDDTIPGSLSLNIQWLNTSQVTNMENMFGYKEV